MSNRLAAAQIAGSIARRTNEGIEAASWHLARQFDRVIPMRQMLWFAKARIETLPATLKRLRR
ncbi:hypothetical protein SAMN05421666_2214 [Roseovarius nanhaiticus]|uniref:Uncharacterized protein n=2 Tax=Roseovarius nanhaiticus TaxID=573024 RepID=A0A1N7GYB0_9RHOB|nr:hypothetical protein SAMN05216208_3105 [Roseovarius nanhaiticus]SIS17438.1 hypothetical protein SAMN05421666_2214 [Roseovarius nanhaiticus]